MKYTFDEATELVDGPEVMVDGVEILDTGDVSFDPPQFTQVSQVPQVFEQVENGLGYGPVTGLNCAGQGGDSTGNCTPQQLVWGMDNNKYKVVDNTLTPLTQEEADALDAVMLAEQTVTQNEASAKEMRLSLTNANISVFGVDWQVGPDDRENIIEAIDYVVSKGLPDTTSREWILFDNTTRTTTKTELVQIINEYVERKELIFDAYIIWRAGDMLSEFTY